MKRYFGALFAFLLLSLPAQAATCFWVGGTGDFDNANVASWSSSTGGAGSTCAATGGIPKNNTDVATFDANSGGGTVTVCGAASANCPSSAGNLNLGTGSINITGFGGTLDFAAIDPAVTMGSFICGSTGTRTMSMGDGTWTVGNTAGTVWSCGTPTGLTLNANGSTLLFNGTSTSSGRGILLGALTYNNVTISNSPANALPIDTANGGAFTIGGSLTLTGVRFFRLTAGVTHTITGTFTFDGATNAPAMLLTNGSAATVSVAAANTWSWIAIANITISGAGTIAANNSFNTGGATGAGLTINNPASGGGNNCIGC